MDNAIYENYLECRRVFEEHPSELTRTMLLGAASVLYGNNSAALRGVACYVDKLMPVPVTQPQPTLTWWGRLIRQVSRG